MIEFFAKSPELSKLTFSASPATTTTQDVGVPNFGETVKFYRLRVRWTCRRESELLPRLGHAPARKYGLK